jgi:aarF domain-containing kinase
MKMGRKADGPSQHAETGVGANGATGDGGVQLDAYEQSVRMKERLKRFLVDTDKMPKELIFLGRNMRCVYFTFVSPISPSIKSRIH